MKQKVFITGSSRGLGLCLARKYLMEGDTVFAGVRSTEAPLIKELEKEYPGQLIPVLLEVTATASIKEAVEAVSKHTHKLDIIINNAAIHSDSSFKNLEDTDVDDCLIVYDVNSVGPIRVVKEFLPFLRRSSLAKVINVSSESGSISSCRREKEFDYCMSKAALNMGSKLLSNYLKKDNIIVLAVHPGWMRTDMGGSNADLDPYETACQLIELFDEIKSVEHPVFIDNAGNIYPW